MMLIILCLIGFGGGCKSEKQPELVMFCAAGMKVPMTRIAAQYEAETGVAVRLQFAGSGTLLGNLRVAPGDIYLAADASYIAEAQRFQLLAETYVVARMTAGLAVPRGNPKGLVSIQDLIDNPKLRYAVGNPAAASIGRHTQTRLSQVKLWPLLTPTVMFPTVNELANAIELGSVDAGIVWDAVAHQYAEVDFIALPEFTNQSVEVTVALTNKASDNKWARDFCRYLINPDKGQSVFKQEGYTLSSSNAHAG